MYEYKYLYKYIRTELKINPMELTLYSLAFTAIKRNRAYINIHFSNLVVLVKNLPSTDLAMRHWQPNGQGKIIPREQKLLY